MGAPRAPPVAVDEACADIAGQLPGGARVLRLRTLRGSAPVAPSTAAGPDDLAFLQFSSGSTGAPKGVELTHAAVLANLRQLVGAAALTDRDVVAGWMPYFHDMGLIGTHLAPVAARAKQVRIEPLSFARNPRLWFDVAAAHRATVLSAANFALALTLRRVPAEVFAGLDLSAVRLMTVGAEPVSATVWRDFAALTAPSGLDPRAATPVYGLAEATLTVAFPPPGEIAVPVAVERAALSRGRVVGSEPGGGAVELMDVGFPVPGCEVRITDGAGRPLGESRVGHIEVRGPQVARGYHRLPEATAAAFAGGWLRTGDLGFLRDGRLCVSGRHKDVLFVNGLTFHAPDMEEVAAATPGVPSGTTVVVGSTDPVTGGERVVVSVAWARPPRSAAGVLDRVAGRVRAALGHDDVRVFALPPSAFPRTTSGKVRRQRMRSRFEAGTFRPSASSGDTVGTAGRVPPPAAGDTTGAPRPRARVRGVVREVWARVLGLPEASFGDRDRFTELGGGSLKAMEVLAGLERALDVTLGPGVMRHDTVDALTDHLLGTGGDTAGDTVGRRTARHRSSGTPEAGDGAPPDAHRVFGPFATAVPVRPAGAADRPLTDGEFARAMRRIAVEAEEARAHEDVVPRHPDGLPMTSQFFFTWLDFTALAPRGDGALRVSWEAGDSAFVPPSPVTDLFLAARPGEDGLRVTLRGAAAAFSAARLEDFARSVRGRLERAAEHHRVPATPRPAGRRTLDAALVGYLPAPDHLARLAGLPPAALSRAHVRSQLFPEGRPRLLETVGPPLGRSGFVCVPLFADELGRGTGLVDQTARAVSLAASLGARCVSLAGTIPSLTRYGFDVLRHRQYPAAVTTGHATTVVSVVRTVHAALDATGRGLADLDVAFAGLGSIGASSLELLLSLADRPPRRLLLCDVRDSGPRLSELGRRLRESGLAGEVEARRMLPDAVHHADLLVTAVSGSTTVLDVDRLRPGAVVVDDSFPHCFDTGRALARMREGNDVLVLGGGLLHVGRTVREAAAGLPDAAAAGHLAQPWIDGTLASCRTESLLHAADDRLPLVHGLVDTSVARAYWNALEAAGVTAAPLHLLGHTVVPGPGVRPSGPPSETELRR